MREFNPNDPFLLYAPGAGSGLPDVAARHDEHLAASEPPTQRSATEPAALSDADCSAPHGDALHPPNATR